LNVARARKQGLPVDDFVTADWKKRSGISAGGGAISLMNQAPHPNAAKLLINWFLSAKGQRAAKDCA
jgi:ABC-type Fe3+ transport system substrate-binding protein